VNRPPGRILPRAFYARDTLIVARELLGCLLSRRESDGSHTWGRIVETEAYVGEDDPACHARAGRTPRTLPLYGPPGRSYVYFNYGMHHLFNAVTADSGFPAAVLVRALAPEGGLPRMRGRRSGMPDRDLASGPGRLAEALGIDLSHNDISLRRGNLVIRDDGGRGGKVLTGPRVGIREGLDRPWRFVLEGDPHVSRGRLGTAISRGRA
jgi:DNA-3-methyladenine glycosylase